MNSPKKTKTQLLGELKNLREQIAELKKNNQTNLNSEDQKESPDWQEALFEGARDAIFISNSHSKFIKVNQAASDLTGYSKEELLKKRMPDLHDKVDLKAYREYHAAIMSGEEIVREARILRKDGTKVETEFNNRRITIAGDHYMHIIARDVSQRKRAEYALRDMNVALTNAMTGISRLDPLGKYISVNKPYAEMLGYKRDELLGNPWQKTVHLEDQPNAVSAYLAMVKDGKAEFEGKGIRKDGSEFHKHVLMVRASDDKGQFIGHHCFVRDISDRKMAEVALRSSQERYRVLFEENPSMCFTVDAKGKVLSVNKTGAEQLGYVVEELVGKSVIDVFYEDDKKAVKKQLSNCLRKPDEIATWELRKVTKKGDIVWVREIARTIQDLEGEPILFIGCENITARKQAKEALQLSKERYDLAVQASKVGVWDWNIETNEIYLDPRLKKLLGYEDNEIRNHMDDWIKFVYPADIPQVETKAREHLAGKTQQYECEHRMIHKDGSIRWFLARGVVTRDRKGKPVRMIGSDTCITARKVAEDALRESETRFRDFYDNAPDIYVILDPDRMIIDINRRGLDRLGYKNTDVKKKPFAIFLHIEDVEKTEALLSHSKETGEMPRNIEVRLMDKKKEFMWVSLEMSLLCTHEGELQAFRIACRDITERKQLQDQLARAQRLETAGRVAGQIAHDFNNLLAPLIGFPPLIRNHLPPDHPVVELIDEMELSSNEIAEISQQLLALGRRGYYKLEPLNLNDLINKILASQSLPREIKLQEKLDSNLFLIKGGKTQLSRVLINLLNNAKEAMNHIGVLSIKTRNLYLDSPLAGYQNIDKGEYVQVEISDTGGGIDPDVLDRIFDPFFTTKKMDRMRGSGLGLSVVHGIVEDHNGYITVQSLIGQGTTFSLYFPITREFDSAKNIKEAALTGGHETILVIDDDPIQRSVINQLLRSLGYKVDVVESGEEALSKVRKRKYDLLILDMVMDGIDGTETFRQILQMKPNQKAIIVSGYAVYHRVKNALRLGVGAFLSKPLKMDELAGSVRKVLDGQKERLANGVNKSVLKNS